LVTDAKLAQSAYKDQLEKWGIDEARSKELGLKLIYDASTIYVPESAKAHVLAAIEIPYYDYDGNPWTDPAQTVGKVFCRYRYLWKTMPFGQEPPDCKYAQEDGTKPAVYFPPDTEWAGKVKDAGQFLVITEGELKAAMASWHEFPTIALGGVWSFRSKQHGIQWIEQLEAFEWRKREVYIVYDSDVARKKDVANAMNFLAAQLFARGAKVFVALLPEEIKDRETGGVFDKVGLDDYLINVGPDAFEQLLKEAQPMSAVEPLFQMNDRYCYVRDLNAIYDTKTDGIIQANAITNAFSFVNYHQVRYAGGDDFKFERANIAKVWMEWPLRNDVITLTYEPGGDEYLQTSPYIKEVNVWQGWGVEPKKGKVQPFLDLVDYVLGNCAPEHRKWFLQWLAYPVQHPGAKLNQACVIYGPQGSGKTMIGELMGLLYGKNYRIVGQDQIASQFNEWMHGLQFIMGDEISGTGSAEHRRVADKLKHLITGQMIMINRKNANLYELPNHCNFYFTSNHPDAFFLENNDRRYFIVETPGQHEKSFYDAVADWRDAGGVEHLMYYLQHLDLSSFDPKANAPTTDAKLDMMNSSRSNLGLWLSDLVGSTEIKVGNVTCDSDLYTTKQLRTWYEAETEQRVTDQAVTMELKRMGVKQVCGGGQVRFGPKVPLSKSRLWAIRNPQKWLKATETECAKHYAAKFASVETIAEAVENAKKKK